MTNETQKLVTNISFSVSFLTEPICWASLQTSKSVLCSFVNSHRVFWEDFSLVDQNKDISPFFFEIGDSFQASSDSPSSSCLFLSNSSGDFRLETGICSNLSFFLCRDDQTGQLTIEQVEKCPKGKELSSPSSKLEFNSIDFAKATYSGFSDSGSDEGNSKRRTSKQVPIEVSFGTSLVYDSDSDEFLFAKNSNAFLSFKWGSICFGVASFSILFLIALIIFRVYKRGKLLKYSQGIEIINEIENEVPDFSENCHTKPIDDTGTLGSPQKIHNFNEVRSSGQLQRKRKRNPSMVLQEKMVPEKNISVTSIEEKEAKCGSDNKNLPGSLDALTDRERGNTNNVSALSSQNHEQEHDDGSVKNYKRMPSPESLSDFEKETLVKGQHETGEENS